MTTSEEQILLEAEQKTAKAYGDSPSVLNLREWEAAKKALATFRERQQGESAAERFKNIEQAASWIVGEGYLVSTRTIRNHADRVPGFPRKQKDGSYLKGEISAYASATWENPSKPRTGGGEDESDHKKRYMKEQADKLALANEITRKNYILRTDVEQRCAAAASFLKKDLANYGPRVCDRLVEVMANYLRGQGLDIEDVNLQAVIPDLLEEYDKKLDSWLDRYAKSTTFEAEAQ